MPYRISVKDKTIKVVRLGRVGKNTLVPRESISLPHPLSDDDESKLTAWYAERQAERKARGT